MSVSTSTPLSHLNADDLYKLLGSAWIAQLQPKAGSCHYIGSSIEIGKQEFAAISCQLRCDLGHPHNNSFLSCVTSTIERHAEWAMPCSVVTELEERLGFFTMAPVSPFETSVRTV